MLESYSMYERFLNFAILSYKTSTSLGYFICFPPGLWFLSKRTFSRLVFTSSQNVNWRKPLCPSHIRCYILSNWQNHILAYNGQQFWSTLALLCLKNSPEERNNYQECFCFYCSNMKIWLWTNSVDFQVFQEDFSLKKAVF